MLKPITKVAVVAILSFAGAAWTTSGAAFAHVSDQEVAGMSGAGCPTFVWHVCTDAHGVIPQEPDPKCDKVRCWIKKDLLPPNTPGVTRKIQPRLRDHREWCTTDGSKIRACGYRFKDGRDCARTGSF